MKLPEPTVGIRSKGDRVEGCALKPYSLANSFQAALRGERREHTGEITLEFMGRLCFGLLSPAAASRAKYHSPGLSN